MRYGIVVPLKEGAAFVLGDAPMDTAVKFKNGKVILVRVDYCEPDFDVDAAVDALDESIFATPDEIVEFTIASSPLVLFDSAYPGDDTDEQKVFSLAPGCYQIQTRVYEPPNTFLVLHRFDPVSDLVSG